MPRSINCRESVDGYNKVAAIRTVKLGRVQSSTSLKSNESALEIDSHADITVLGSNCLPIHDFGRSLDVSGLDTNAGSVDFPTIYRAIEYYHQTSGQV